MAFSQDVSRNFESAKVASILIVAAGHFFPPSAFWIVVSAALCLFGFASGYFTAHIYGATPPAGRFIGNKLSRLGPDLQAINLLLLVLFLVQGRAGIFSWQSLLGVTGLSGFLGWFYLPNPSPFGGGLWYFTLLLLFYIAYPLLARLLRPGAAGAVATFVLLLAAFVLSDRIRYGHMLWLTAFSFCFGVAYVNQRWQASVRHSMLLFAALAVAAAIARFGFGAPVTSLVAISALALIVIQGLLRLHLPAWLHAPFKPFAACVLEIYILHTHFFIHPTGLLAIDFAASLLLILAVSLATRKLAERLPAFSAPRAAVGKA